MGSHARPSDPVPFRSYRSRTGSRRGVPHAGGLAAIRHDLDHMIKGFALSAVTGVLALFGLNSEVPYAQVKWPKFSTLR